MKIQELLRVKGVFAPLIRTKLAPKLSYKLLKFIRAIEFEENFLNEKVREVLNEFGEKDERGEFVFDQDGNVSLIKGKEDDCKKAIDELNNIEVTTPDVSFGLEELQDLSLSVIDIAVIEKFIKEE